MIDLNVLSDKGTTISAFINFVRSQFPGAELPAEGWDQAWAGYIANAIHRDVFYGGGLDMLAQVQSTRKALDGTKYKDDRAITAATFLHKIGEKKRLNSQTEAFLAEQRKTNPNYDIWGALYDYFGQPETMNPAILRALEIVNEIKIFDKAVDDYEKAKIAELGEEAGKSAAQEFQVRFLSGKMTDDDRKFAPSALGGELSADARVVLIAEKIANFETSRDKPNTKKQPEWHRNYTLTRKAVVDAASAGIDPNLLNKANNIVTQLLAKYPENTGNTGGGGAALPPGALRYHDAMCR